MRSGRVASQAVCPATIPNTGTWRTKKIPGVGLRATAVFTALIITMAVIGLDAPRAAAQSDMNSFITTWVTTSANESITFPGTGTYTINWGDGDTDTNVSGTQTHTYAAAGDHTVSVSGGLTAISLGDDNSFEYAHKLKSIDQWGNIGWTSMRSAFEGAIANYNATDTPDLSRVTDMSSMFYLTSISNGNLSGWDTSSVTHMNNMFRSAFNFNGNLSGWDTSSVTDMSGMFGQTDNFNSDISGWNTSSVTDMSDMFFEAHGFNSDIGDWDTSSVTDMSGMFTNTLKFNSAIINWNTSSVTDMSFMFSDTIAFNGELGNWNTSSVTDMSHMFHNAHKFNNPVRDWNVANVRDMSFMFTNADKFNQHLNSWDTRRVTDMSHMFSDADVFNGNINEWDVAKVTDMNDMFRNAVSFNGDLDIWNLFIVTDMNEMFRDAVSFNGDISNWDVDTVTDMSGMFRNAVSFNGDIDDNISDWDVSAVTDMSDMFRNAVSFNDAIYDWDPGRVTDMSGMFDSATSFNSEISGWNTEGVTDMSDMFRNATSFNRDLYGDTGWNTEGVTDMSGMFDSATSFDGDISGLDTSKVTDMSDMFDSATDFNGNVSGWDTSKVTDMSGMFDSASNFNRGISGWDVSGVDDMSRMFASATDFNGNVSGWDVSDVEDMSHMFDSASSFNGNISGWDTGLVTDMSDMFRNATIFNGNISGWDIGLVTDMSGMFDSATSFNGNISGWDVSGVDDMSRMFASATSFNGNISGWDVSGVDDMSRMFASATIFNGTISGWDVSGVEDMSHMFDSASSFNGNISGWDISSVDDMSSMFQDAAVFNQNISVWDVSNVDEMTDMFLGADSFEQNLGNWYVVPASTSIARTAIPGTVGGLSAQNAYLVRQNPAYGIVASADSGHFVISDGNRLSMISADSKGSYTVNMTATGNMVFEDGGNWRIFTVTVEGADTTAPRVASIERHAPVSQNTTDTSLTFRVTFSESVQNVDVADFETTGTSTTSISGITGAGKQYDVAVTAAGTGTVGLALVSSGHGITDGAMNPLTDLTPTGTNESYNIVLPGDTTAPRVASIERYFPVSQNTTDKSLTFRVTFSELVQNVDAADFEAAGTASVFDITGTGKQYDVAVTAAGTGTVGLALVSSGHGITDGSMNLLTDLTPTGANESYNIVLPGDTTAPRVASIERHAPVSQNTTDTSLTFRVTFSEPVQNVDATDFEAAGTASASVSGITGTGNRYDVEVTATGTGTVGLALVSSGHGITDGSANPLTDLTPTGANESYNVVLPADTTAPRVASIERHSPASHDTTEASLTFRVTFSELVQNVDVADFEAAGTASASVSGITGTGNRYDVEVTATGTGTVGLALISSGHGITDGAMNLLTDRTPTGANESYNVVPADTTAPRVASIERHFPESQDTTDKSLTFRVTFSEPVRNVDVADFEAAGTASISGITGTGKQYDVAVTATGTGTVGLALISSGHGITDGSANPLTDRAPTGANESYSVMPSDTSNIQPTVSPRRGGGGGGSSSGTSLPTVMAPAIDLSTLITTKLASLPQSVTRSLDTFDPNTPLEPARVPSQFDPPLTINGNKYLLGGTTSTLEPQTVMTGEPTEIPFTVYSANDIERFSLYLNLQELDTDYSGSDTYVTYTNGNDTVRVTDPHGYISNATVAVTEPDPQRHPEKKIVHITLEFGKPMGPTNMVAYLQDTDKRAAIAWIIDALDVVAAAQQGPEVQAADPEPVEPGLGLPADPEPISPDTLRPGDYDEAHVLTLIRMWSGFESEMITDEQMLTSLGLDGDYPDAYIPDWMMTKLGVLVASGDVTVDEFMLALQYVLEHA